MLLLIPAASVTAGTVLGPWVPVYKGVDYAVGTNTPGSGGFPDLHVICTMRVDLTDPDIRLFASPRTAKGDLLDEQNYQAGHYDTAGYKTSSFLKNHGLQVAINANNFHDPGTADSESPDYGEAEGTPFVVDGVLISQGVIVSTQNQGNEVAAFLFTTNNQATFIPTNWPAHSTVGANTAVTGLYTVLANGVNIGSNYISDEGAFPHGVNPRTALGLSKDRRYLYLMAIDGRQSGYSDGAVDWETAAWLLKVGAWDGANMDGGGSTCLVMADSTGAPLEVNQDSSSAAYGYQRTDGAHLGVYAKPLPGFFNDVFALPDDTAATITWTTTEPATTQVSYGLSTAFTLTSVLNSALSTNHAVLLTNLTPGTGYYFAAVSSTTLAQHVSSNFFFVTSNYATTNAVFDLTQTWMYATSDLDGVNWTAPGYDDSHWDGQGPGVLWVDTRGPDPMGDIPVALATEMPLDSGTGYPFITYYLRTHFNLTNNPAGVWLECEAWVDDGAVFYLNGAEIYRVCMPAAPALISNSTLASSYYCSGGDASCPIDFIVSGPVMTNLVAGDNVLAVEVHNYNARSPDITFGMSLSVTVPLIVGPQLSLVSSNRTAVLSWTRGGFTLQQADSPEGPWTDVPGPVFTSPYADANPAAARFFRLRR